MSQPAPPRPPPPSAPDRHAARIARGVGAHWSCSACRTRGNPDPVQCLHPSGPCGPGEAPLPQAL